MKIEFKQSKDEYIKSAERLTKELKECTTRKQLVHEMVLFTTSTIKAIVMESYWEGQESPIENDERN